MNFEQKARRFIKDVRESFIAISNNAGRDGICDYVNLPLEKRAYIIEDFLLDLDRDDINSIDYESSVLACALALLELSNTQLCIYSPTKH